MTDRELLESLKAQIDAHLAPVVEPPIDEVVSDWELLPENIGPLSACQPNGFKHRSEMWTKRTLVPASNGGATYDGPREEIRTNDQAEACIYVPPSGGVISYRVDIETHTHYFTDPAEMKVWVPRYVPRIPEPVPCSIEWRGYDRVDHRETFATFAEFRDYIAAFIPETPPVGEPDPDVLPFPADWREAWPTWTPETSLSLAPAGWVTGQGFKERRAFVEANWWDTGANVGTEKEGDIDRARHLHIGAAFPRKVSGVFDLHVRIRTFHWSGANLVGITDVKFNRPGARKLLPTIFADGGKPVSIFKLPLTDHIHDVYVPLRIDTRGCTTDGWTLLVVETDIQRDDGVHHLVNVKVPVYVENGNPVQDMGGTGVIQASGWMTEFVNGEEINTFAYLETECLMRFDAVGGRGPKRFADDAHATYEFRGNTAIGRFPLEMLVTKNPNFHLHPAIPREDPAYMGQVLADEVSIGNSSQRVVVPSESIGAGDRIVCRVSDRKPPSFEGVSDPRGAAATVLAISVGS